MKNFKAPVGNPDTWPEQEWEFVTDPIIKYLEHDGEVDWDNLIVRLDDKLKDKVLLESLIHEIKHIQCPWMDEEAVTNFSKQLADILWDKMNLRFVEREEEEDA